MFPLALLAVFACGFALSQGDLLCGAAFAAVSAMMINTRFALRLATIKFTAKDGENVR